MPPLVYGAVMHLNAVKQLVLKETAEQNLVLCFWKDVSFPSVSASDHCFYGPGVNRVITAWNPNNTVMNEPAGWGRGGQGEIMCFGMEQCLVAEEDPATIYGHSFVHVHPGKATP